MNDEPLEVALSAPDAEKPVALEDASGTRALVIDRAVAREVREHCASDTSVEQAGLLFGRYDDGVLEITGSTIAVGADCSAASVRFTHQTWDHANEVLEREHPGARMVGWYHSHPGFSVFLSEYDLFIHENFFNQPWQVAYVNDPLIHDEGFFGWEGGRVVRYREWDEHVRTDADAPVSERSAAPATPVGTAPPPTSRYLFGAAALLVGAIGGVAIGTYVSSSGSEPRREVHLEPVERRDGVLVDESWSVHGDRVDMRIAIYPPEDVDPGAFVRVPVPEVFRDGGRDCAAPGGVVELPPERSAFLLKDLCVDDPVNENVELARTERAIVLDEWATARPTLQALVPQLLPGQVGPVTFYSVYPDGTRAEIDVGAVPWTVQPEGIVEVQPDGNVRALAPGTATLRYAPTRSPVAVAPLRATVTVNAPPAPTTTLPSAAAPTSGPMTG